MFDYLGGYQIGYRLQASRAAEFQRAALTVAGVPDGEADAAVRRRRPYCVGRAGTAGSIVAAGPELQFEGDGTYTVTVSLGPGGRAARLPVGTLDHRRRSRVDAPVAPVLAGEPSASAPLRLPATRFVGVRAAAPPGG